MNSKKCYGTIITDKSMLNNLIRIRQRMKYLHMQYDYIIFYPKEDLILEKLLKLNQFKIIPISIYTDKYKYYLDIPGNDYYLLKYELLNFTQYDIICLISPYSIIIKNLDFLFDNINQYEMINNFIHFHYEYLIPDEQPLHVLTETLFLIKPNFNIYNKFQNLLYFIKALPNFDSLKTFNQEQFLQKSNKTLDEIIINFYPLLSLHRLNSKYYSFFFDYLLFNKFNWDDNNSRAQEYNLFIDKFSSFLNETKQNIFLTLNKNIWNSINIAQE